MKKTNMKKGITLIEIILAIVLIAIILGVTIPKLMTNSAKAEIKTVITSDVKSILESAATWRKSSSLAGGSYQTITSAALDSRLPSNMILSDDGVIMSSGLKTGDQAGNADETGVSYVVAWSSVANAASPAVPTNSFAIAGDFRQGAVKLNWNAKIQAYAREVFTDVIAEATDGTAVGHNAQSAGVITSTPNGGAAVTFTCSQISDFVCFDQVQVR